MQPQFKADAAGPVVLAVGTVRTELAATEMA